MSDDTGMNELLSKHVLYEGASVFLSNGEMVIPYEDGFEPNNEQKACKLKSLRNSDRAKLEGLLHDQRKASLDIKGIQTEIEKLNGQLTDENIKGAYKKNKEINDEINRLDNVLAQTQKTVLMTQSEITRIVTHIAVYDEEIAVLEGKSVVGGTLEGAEKPNEGKVN